MVGVDLNYLKLIFKYNTIFNCSHKYAFEKCLLGDFAPGLEYVSELGYDFKKESSQLFPSVFKSEKASSIKFLANSGIDIHKTEPEILYNAFKESNLELAQILINNDTSFGTDVIEYLSYPYEKIPKELCAFLYRNKEKFGYSTEEAIIDSIKSKNIELLTSLLDSEKDDLLGYSSSLIHGIANQDLNIVKLLVNFFISRTNSETNEWGYLLERAVGDNKRDIVGSIIKRVKKPYINGSGMNLALDSIKNSFPIVLSMVLKEKNFNLEILNQFRLEAENGNYTESLIIIDGFMNSGANKGSQLP
ncbi:hypothetical protein AYI68_g4261 [Smittium mucronatum]|uniref:Ankyrin repeat protein n=1 Tax=Smittium mucronatum TaxID=133383 RepID=A0A1R0GXL2_9FUNG|nr:hypothetical protein AYI68_g4261 [Smittium mucronatum]